MLVSQLFLERYGYLVVIARPGHQSCITEPPQGLYSSGLMGIPAQYGYQFMAVVNSGLLPGTEKQTRYSRPWAQAGFRMRCQKYSTLAISTLPGSWTRTFGLHLPAADSPRPLMESLTSAPLTPL